MATAAVDPGISTLDKIERNHLLAMKVLQKVKERNITSEPPRSGPNFSISQAAGLVSRSASAIRMAEAEGRLPHQERNSHGRRQGYTLRELDHMRQIFETRPWRSPDDKCAIVACQNFKGGVGKSTISVHLAQYLAMQGYRVLLVDADAQASTTMMFGYIPDQDLEELDSIYSLTLVKEGRGVRELIRKTHYHNLDLIPSNLKLYNAEYELAARIRSHGFEVLGVLGRELQRVTPDYDVIIMDPPPALGMISLSVLYAANSLLIPMPPNIVDFASTTAFLGMLSETMGVLSRSGMTPDYGFIQMIISKSNESVATQREIVEMANGVFGKTVLETEIKTSAEIDHATSRLQSVYDLAGPTTSHEVRRRCLRQLNDANREIEKHIRSLWPNTLDPRD